MPSPRRPIRRARRRGLVAGAAAGALLGRGMIGDPTKALERLANLRDRGAITAQEFELEKRRLVGDA